MSTRCNRCYLEDLQKLGEPLNGHVVIKPVQKNDEYNDALFGYDIFVLYPQVKEPAWAMWLAAIPNRCTCGS